VAKMEQNPVITGLTGPPDELVIQIGRGGQTIVCVQSRPSKTEPTQTQTEHLASSGKQWGYINGAATKGVVYAGKGGSVRTRDAALLSFQKWSPRIRTCNQEEKS
jgi:hypothetical protein